MIYKLESSDITAITVMSGRQSQSMLIDLMPGLLGAAISGKLSPYIMPALIKVIIIPLLNIINTISKAFVFIGLLAYFTTLSIPILLAHFGIYYLSINIKSKIIKFKVSLVAVMI